MQGVREGLGTKADSPARQHMPQHRHSLQACSSYPGKSAALCPKKGVFNSHTVLSQEHQSCSSLENILPKMSLQEREGKGRKGREGHRHLGLFKCMVKMKWAMARGKLSVL